MSGSYTVRFVGGPAHGAIREVEKLPSTLRLPVYNCPPDLGQSQTTPYVPGEAIYVLAWTPDGGGSYQYRYYKEPPHPMSTDPYYQKENMMETVTIPRDVYETLVKAYTSVKQRAYADSIAATVRSLTNEELGKLPAVKGLPKPDVSTRTPSTVLYVEEMLRDGSVYKDVDGDCWRWSNDTLELRDTEGDEPEFYKYTGIENPNVYAPFTSIS